MYRNGIPIQNHPLTRRVDAGITIEQDHEEISEFDSREACVYTNYNWTEWQTLSSGERAMCIAQHRIHLLIEAHVHAASDAKSEQMSRRNRKGG